jgi:hypothetical protein
MTNPSRMERTNAWLAHGVVALCAAFATWQATRVWSFDTDDAFITLRYAKHLAEGHGITWNVADPVPVEGYSNFSYVLIAALALRLGGDALLWLKLIGTASLLVSCVLSFWVTRRLVGQVAATVPAILLAAYPGTTLWAVSGLETLFYMALVLATLGTFFSALDEPAEAQSRRRLQWAGLLGLLVACTRPEGPLVMAILALALCLHVARSRGLVAAGRPLVSLLAPFALPYTAYTLWRLVHFERLVPNTVLCKVGIHGGPYDIVASFLALAIPYVPLALCLAPRRIDIRHVVLWAVPVVYAVLLVGVDPMIGYYNRHVLTAWVPLLVLFTVGLVNVTGWMLRGAAQQLREWLVVAAVLGWTSAVGAGPVEFDTVAMVDVYAQRMAARRELGAWLSTRVGSGERYLIGDCGMVPYIAEGVAIDAFCLNNRAMTTPPIAGSQDAFIDSVLADPPEYVIVHSLSSATLTPRPDYGFYPRLLAQGRFPLRYGLVRKFGVPGDDFHYWVLRRFANAGAAPKGSQP